MKDNRSRNKIRITHILKAIDEINSYVEKGDRDSFLKDSLFSSAVLFQFSVIGEAVVNIDSTILGKYDYPWYKVRSFRNMISHEYFNIKLDAVWEVIIKDLPDLREVVETILQQEF